MRLLVPSSLLFAALVLFGCERSRPPAAQPPAEPTTQAVAAVDPHAGHNHDGDGCSEATETKKLEHVDFEKVTGPDGVSFLRVGAQVEGAPEVTIAELISAPEAWAGKQVRISGDISAMCDHKRAWFAVVNEGDQTGTQLQVRTAPAFLVPEGSVGKRARAIGTVEVVEVARKEAAHLEEEHKLPTTAEQSGKLQRVIVRAVGADFI
jgi:hypothetical protein